MTSILNRTNCTLCVILGLLAAQAAAGNFDVRQYGAKGDGKTLDTAAINKAVEAASDAGGGTVYFPAGTYMSYSIRLKSNITLYFDQGTTLVAAEPKGEEGYDLAEPNPTDMYQDYGHSHWHDSLIWGEHLENIALMGPGLIHGKHLDRWDSDTEGRGNKILAIKQCKNVIIRDVSFLMGGHFCILATGIDNFTVDNIKIDTNRDGINIDCCRNVRVSNCTVNSPFDDGICLKSSYGLGFARATENVTITNCQVSAFDPGTLLDGTYTKNETGAPDKRGVTGRIKFGTESNGGFKNIAISNCVFHHCRGLALETVDGGLLEDVTINNITMTDTTTAPIFLRLGSRMRGPEGTPVGKLRRVNISNVTVYDADPRYGSIITGIAGHPVEDVRLDNVRIYYRGGGTVEQAKLLPPEIAGEYPEPSMFGEMPAYGFYMRHVDGIQMNNVKVAYMSEDQRPPFMLDRVTNAEFLNVTAQHEEEVPVFVLKDVENFRTVNSEIEDTKLQQVQEKRL